MPYKALGFEPEVEAIVLAIDRTAGQMYIYLVSLCERDKTVDLRIARLF